MNITIILLPANTVMVNTMIEALQNPPAFLLYALIGGLLITLISAPLGVFMVWQRQSYFGATLAHSALLGVSLGFLIDLHLTVAVMVTSVLIALIIFNLSEKTLLSADTLLGLMAHSSLAIGLVIISLQKNIQIDVMSYLVGDILSITQNEILGIIILGFLISLFFYRHWYDLLNITLNKDLAQVEGIQYRKVQLTYTVLLALFIAFAMKVVGVLLITSLLIIPAAAAHKFSRTPSQMLAISALFGMASVMSGLLLSLYLDIPTGPAIVMMATAFFLLSLTKNRHV